MILNDWTVRTSNFNKHDVIEPKKYMTEGRSETAPLMTLAHIGGFGKCLEHLSNNTHIFKVLDYDQ